MSAAVDILLPVLGASTPSKAPFYIAGSVLAAWAVVVALLGITRAGFPGSTGGARMVMGLSALLVAVTVATAILTASKHHGDAHAASEPGAAQGHPPNEQPPPAGEGTTTPGKSPRPAGSGSLKVQIAADPSGQLKFQQSSVTAKPGQVTIEFDNPSPVPHDVTVARGSTKLGATKVVTAGKATTKIALQPGSYTFYCSVDGHRAAGMQGTLAVQP
jgi:plastocyanin